MNCTTFTYYVTLMAKCTCSLLHHPLKILPNAMFLSCTDSNRLTVFLPYLYSTNTAASVCKQYY